MKKKIADVNLTINNNIKFEWIRDEYRFFYKPYFKNQNKKQYSIDFRGKYYPIPKLKKDITKTETKDQYFL